MKRIHNFRLTFATTLAVGLLSLSYMVSEYFDESLFFERRYIFLGLSMVSLLLSLVSTTFLTDFFLRYKWVRKVIYGNKFIEGFWLFDSVLEKDVDSGSFDKCTEPLIPALGEIFYDTEKRSYVVVFYRYHPNRAIKDSFTYSNSIIFDDYNLRYMNQFKYEGNEGCAFGNFFSSPGIKFPDQYRGKMLLSNGKQWIRQCGWKIGVEILQEARKQDKKDWRRHILEKEMKSLKLAF